MIHTQDADFTLICADVLDGLRSLEAESVHCVVTSPPYWSLRDYGTGLWAGGDEDCDHQPGEKRMRKFTNSRGEGVDGDRYAGSNLTSWTTRDATVKDGGCPKGCGATRQDQQLGLEATPDLYVARIVEVFREVRRVLRADGTCWVNLGDSYAATQTSDRHMFQPTGPNGTPATTAPPQIPTMRTATGGLKPKDLVGIPWRVAFALQADGWYLRSDIIWSKPNPMPESVTDRPTKAHEYVFLLSKEARYFFDAEAVREAHQDKQGLGRFNGSGGSTPAYEPEHQGWVDGGGFKMRPGGRDYNPAGRNVRSVWDIATQPYPEAHFATYPEELVRRCVLAGTSERGCCAVCGKPWEREVEVTYDRDGSRASHEKYDGHDAGLGTHPGLGRAVGSVQTLGWRPGCNHNTDPVPCTVLDPFLGSGTTAYVARKHGRRSIGIELSPEYCDLAARRMQQQSLLV